MTKQLFDIKAQLDKVSHEYPIPANPKRLMNSGLVVMELLRPFQISSFSLYHIFSSEIECTSSDNKSNEPRLKNPDGVPIAHGKVYFRCPYISACFLSSIRFSAFHSSICPLCRRQDVNQPHQNVSDFDLGTYFI